MNSLIEITQAGPERHAALASLLGRAFVDEPMVRWSLGEHGDLERRCIACFAAFLDGLFEKGMVCEAGVAAGAAVWIPPDETVALQEANERMSRVHGLTRDDQRRYDEFWAWVETRLPREPLWYLDSVGVAREARGRGIGAALVEIGLARARADGIDAFLATGTSRNVPFYEHRGFRVVDAADAPDGGPRIWFMRYDSAGLAP